MQFALPKLSLAPLLRPLRDIESRDDSAILQSVYTPYSEALKIMEERWNDQELQKRISRLSKLPPEVEAFAEPHTILCRPIITPNRETAYFLDLVKNSGKPHAFFEYHDKFVGRNAAKRALGKVIYATGCDHRGRCVYSKATLVNFNTQEGKMVNEVETRWGESLIDFKHALLELSHPGESAKIHSITKWFNERRFATKFYYFDFLSIFLRHGILFENFLLGDADERAFFFERVLPSVKQIKKVFGIKPLIVPLLPLEFEKSEEWLAYPEHLTPEIRKYATLEGKS